MPHLTNNKSYRITLMAVRFLLPLFLLLKNIYMTIKLSHCKWCCLEVHIAIAHEILVKTYSSSFNSFCYMFLSDNLL